VNDPLATLKRDLEVGQKETRQTVAERVMQQEAGDRYLITRVVLWVFGGSIALVLVVILFGSRESADGAADILKSVVLPVVTLVLGYYFGRAGKG
jgi:type VI protein secretion system component VasF